MVKIPRKRRLITSYMVVSKYNMNLWFMKYFRVKGVILMIR